MQKIPVEIKISADIDPTGWAFTSFLEAVRDLQYDDSVEVVWLTADLTDDAELDTESE